MREIRNIDKSVLHYMRTQLVSIWGSHLTVKDGHPNDLENIKLPTVTINYVSNSRAPREIGTEEGYDSVFWHFLVFARGKGERDDIGCDVCHLLKSGCSIYDFSSGTVGGKLGTLVFRGISHKPIFTLGDSVPRGERNRSVVIARAEVSITGA